MQGLIVFDVDKEKWALDLREGTRSVTKGAPSDKPDLTLTITDDNFVKLVTGKLGPQQVWRQLMSDCRHECTMLQMRMLKTGMCETPCLLQDATLQCMMLKLSVGLPDAEAEDQRQHGDGYETAAYPRCSSSQSQALIQIYLSAAVQHSVFSHTFLLLGCC